MPTRRIGAKPTLNDIVGWLLIALGSLPFLPFFGSLLSAPDGLWHELAHGDVDAIVLVSVGMLFALVLIGVNPWRPLRWAVPVALVVLTLDMVLQLLLLAWPSLAAAHPSMMHPSMLGSTLAVAIAYRSSRRDVVRGRTEAVEKGAA